MFVEFSTERQYPSATGEGAATNSSLKFGTNPAGKSGPFTSEAARGSMPVPSRKIEIDGDTAR